MRETLGEFQETESRESFALQNPKLLKVSLDRVTIQARRGTMVAYQGDVRFEHAGAGGVTRFIKRKVTGEGTQLMRVSGAGEVFLADQAQEVHLMRLEADQITANGANVLAFDAGIDWDIRRVEGGLAGSLAGGLFNVSLSGTGCVAIVSDGPPVLLDTEGAQTVADPMAAIAWSGGVRTHVKTDVNLKTLIGRGSGETVQLGFSGAGWVLVQPSEGRVESTPSSGGS